MSTCETSKTVLPDVTATDSSNTEDMSLPDVIITQRDDTKAVPKEDSAVDQSVNIENIGDKVSNVKKKLSTEGKHMYLQIPQIQKNQNQRKKR